MFKKGKERKERILIASNLFFFLSFYLFVCVYGTHLTRTEDNLKELVLSFHEALTMDAFTCCPNIYYLLQSGV